MNSKPTILSADDDNDDQELIQEAIFTSGADIDFQKVSNGRELIHFLRNTKMKGFHFPRVILLDLNMPVLNGRETLVSLKNNESEIRNIPVIMLSTSAATEDIAFCMLNGAHRFLTKPTSFAELCRLMKKVVAEFCESGNTIRLI